MDKYNLNLEDKAKNCTVFDARHPIVKAGDFYFRPKLFEKDGKVYESLGVKEFRHVLMKTVGTCFKIARVHTVPTNYFIGRGENKDISQYETYSRFNELLHGYFLFDAGTALVSSIAEENSAKIIGLGSFALLNLYCVMLQRYNRSKAYRILEKKGER